MGKRSLVVPILTIAIGGVILLAGLAGAAFYAFYAVESRSGSDQSGLFWYLPILVAGLGGMAAGVMMLVIGIGAGRGSVVCLRISRGLLVAVPLIAMVLVGLSYMSDRSAQREREVWAAQSAERERILADMQRVRRLDIREKPDSGIAVNVATTGGLAGNYELRLKIETSRGTLFQQASRLRLDSSATAIRRSIPYRELFARCFNNADSGELFVCVKGAGTANTRFRLEAELLLLRMAANARVDIQDNPKVFSTSSSAGFFMDTFTRDDRVEIESFRLAEK